MREKKEHVSNLFDSLLNGFGRESSFTYRWNGVEMIGRETVAEHSYWVIFYANYFAEFLVKQDLKLKKDKILQYALLHDFDECWNGDLSHSLKHLSNEDVRVLLKKAEAKNNGDVITKMPISPLQVDLYSTFIIEEQDSDIKFCVKLADIFSMFMFCHSEYEKGNRGQKFLYTYTNICSLITKQIKGLEKQNTYPKIIAVHEYLTNLVKETEAKISLHYKKEDNQKYKFYK